VLQIMTRRPSPLLLLAGPGVLFILVTLLLPLLAIFMFSFWRTESYELYADWNLDNYRVLFTEAAYRTFLLRSVLGALATSLICLVFAWPVAYFIARHGGRYRLLLILLIAAPFFTGIILRIAALQGI
jgi:spermidine/putrescine transport system permease protein